MATTLVLTSWVGCAASASAQAVAGKQDSSAALGQIRAVIVRIDGVDVFLDAGGAALQLDQTLTVYRSIVVRHPVTHASLRDRFSIGTLVVQQVGDALSLAHVSGTAARPFEVGDAVEAPRPPGAAPVNAAPISGAAAAPGLPSAPTSARGSDAETEDLLRYWQASLGKSPTERAGYFRAYLTRWPASRRALIISEEIAYLMKAGARVPQSAAPTTHSSGAPQPSSSPTPRLRFAPLHLARAGEAIDLAASYDTDAAPKNVTVYVRGKDQQDYDTITLQLDGQGHARGRIEAAQVRSPSFTYFVEAVAPDNAVQAVIGDAAQPEEVEVLEVADRPAHKSAPDTRVRFSSEFVSFDASSKDDYFLVNEGDFFQRLDLGVLHGMRMGYGHFLGRGGALDALGENVVSPADAGFSFGFVEGELALHPLFGVATRITVGLGRPAAFAEREAMTGGFQLRVRIGTADGTRLVLAGEALPELGQRAFLGLQWELGQRVFMSTEVHVTDQPVHSDDVGVRLVQEVGYQFSQHFGLSLRPSYQLRTIKHAGPGIGLATTFDW
jgi:hypothetical protein